MSIKVAITATGHFVPETVITNKGLSNNYPISEKDILAKTGIYERRKVTNMNTSQIIILAIKDLLTKSSMNIGDIDCIIVGTLSPDYFFPSTAVNVINNINAKNAWGFDISAACSGFCYSLSIAEDMIKSGTIKNAIVCGAETWTKMLNSFEYKTAVLCGDGAGAVLLEASNDDSGINGKLNAVKADNLEVENVYYKTPFNTNNWSKEKFELNGGAVYRGGVEHMTNHILQYLEKNSLSFDDFNYIIPHQSNLNMLKEIAKELKLSIEKFKINIEYLGNTGAATIPICLSQFLHDKKINPSERLIKGDRVMLVSFGAGYTISIIDVTL